MNKVKIFLMTALLISGYQALVAMDQTAHRAQKAKKQTKQKICQIAGYVPTKHFKARIAQRGITKKAIASAITAGKQKVSSNNSQVNKIVHNNKNGALVIVANQKTKKLITAYNKHTSYKPTRLSLKQLSPLKKTVKTKPRAKEIAPYKLNQFKDRKKITDKVSLEAVTGLQKNIQQAIFKKDTTMAKRLLDLGTPYNSKDKTLAIALSTAIRMNNSDYCKLVLEYVRFPNHLAKLFKSHDFLGLSKKSELYKLLMTKKAEISKENITV